MSNSETDNPNSASLTPLSGDMPAADFRRYGHQLIDWLADFQEKAEQYPVLSQIQPGDLIAQLPTQPPAQGESMDAILADVERLIAQFRSEGLVETVTAEP